LGFVQKGEKIETGKKENSTAPSRLPIYFDIGLVGATAVGLILHYFFRRSFTEDILVILTIAGLVPVIVSAARALLKHELTIDLLAAVALVFALISREWFSAAFINLMLSSARLFSHWTEAKAKSIITHLLKYRPQKVRVRRGERIAEEPLSQVKVGDLVMVESGDRIPVDGEVISGEAMINESSLTGESELVSKKKEDKVLTSTLCESGSLQVKTDKIGEDTTLSRIIALVEEASRKRAKTERIASKFTQWYILAAIVFTVSMYFFGAAPRLILSVLLVVCADDIAVAVPLGFTSAIAHAARRGVVIKGSNAIENLSRLKYFVTDKTGTLTYGRPKVIDCKGFNNFDSREALQRFAIGASSSRHSVARAILTLAKEKGIMVHAPDEFEESPGEGIIFVHNGECAICGRLEFLEKNNVEVPTEVVQMVREEKNAGRGVVLLGVEKKIAGLISYQDELRHESAEVIKETIALGVHEWHMLTGDNEKVAAEAAKKLGVTDYHANMTPEGKVTFVEFLKKKKRGVIGMLGDGVNDAASLALVDVSIAMGAGGTDAAIEAADISLMHDNLRRVPEMIRLSQKTMLVMRENFGIWTATNGVGLFLVFFGVLGPVGAATYNFVTDFFPIMNALRLFSGVREGRKREMS
jgi:Cd2+/Zn2+-exporting ATPase